ncbi:MAG: glycoside hydrolase family 127 protein, partial [Acidobacteria bacterium]|nr:glycoside hydrolase family 127 protein [Acidobacteriota bacterium]
EGAGIRINGAAWRQPVRPGSYAVLRRAWSAGDRVELDLPMPARLIEANPYNESMRGQAAVMRGPIVYCLESPDLPAGVQVDEIRLPLSVKLEAQRRPDLLGGVAALEGTLRRRPRGDWSGLLYRVLNAGGLENLPVRLIPYYAWANRGISHMTVWMPLAD